MKKPVALGGQTSPATWALPESSGKMAFVACIAAQRVSGCDGCSGTPDRRVWPLPSVKMQGAVTDGMGTLAGNPVTLFGGMREILPLTETIRQRDHQGHKPDDRKRVAHTGRLYTGRDKSGNFHENGFAGAMGAIRLRFFFRDSAATGRARRERRQGRFFPGRVSVKQAIAAGKTGRNRKGRKRGFTAFRSGRTIKSPFGEKGLFRE